jgi:hypothetical protein
VIEVVATLREEDADDAGECKREHRIGLEAEKGMQRGEPAQLVEKTGGHPG